MNDIFWLWDSNGETVHQVTGEITDGTTGIYCVEKDIWHAVDLETGWIFLEAVSLEEINTLLPQAHSVYEEAKPGLGLDAFSEKYAAAIAQAVSEVN